MLVGMKGHPGCGKSTLARSLAKALRWPLLDKDDVRDCTRPLQLALSSSASSSSKHDAGEVLLNTMAYQVLWRLAETQLQMGLSIIVDSPLSRPSLFGSAVTLAAAYNTRLIIIECLPSDTLAWRHRLEGRVAASANGSAEVAPIDLDATMSPQADGYGCAGWHKPGCWEDLQALIQNYQGCNEYDIPLPSRKVVVDTTTPSFSADALHAQVLSWLLSVSDDTPLVSYIP